MAVPNILTLVIAIALSYSTVGAMYTVDKTCDCGIRKPQTSRFEKRMLIDSISPCRTYYTYYREVSKDFNEARCFI